MSQSTAPINTKLIDSLAQIILSLTHEERQILEQKIHTPESPSPVDVSQFFQELDSLEIDPTQPTLQEISEVVKDVRRELWATSELPF
ncbi:MAG: hypothetical protein VKJ46_14635 [Leptolyngbyaceae bacterium]|nr:hypothetical protein [Leptolyngbyaceae bacterium]